MWEKLEQINKRYEELVAQMSNPEIATDHVQMTKLAQEKSSLDGIIALYQDYKAAVKSLEDTRAMMNEKLDMEMLVMAKEEAHHLEEKQTRLQEELRLALLPKDPNDEKNIIMEIRAGAGGEHQGATRRGGDVAGDRGDLHSRGGANFLRGLLQCLFAARGDDEVHALVRQRKGAASSQALARRAYQCRFAAESHIHLSSP